MLDDLHRGDRIEVSPERLRQRLHAFDFSADLGEVFIFGAEEGAVYASIVNELGFSRAKVLDRMIAAQAIVADATLATLNPRDFRAIPNLRVEDWSTDA